ncbi:hypothetical protein ACX9NE_18850 [Mycobacterium sp. ML4]
MVTEMPDAQQDTRPVPPMVDYTEDPPPGRAQSASAADRDRV